MLQAEVHCPGPNCGVLIGWVCREAKDAPITLLLADGFARRGTRVKETRPIRGWTREEAVIESVTIEHCGSSFHLATGRAPANKRFPRG